jgi:DNA-nicking Smr family endonuclease
MSTDEPRRRRRLSEDEQRLWAGIARSVTPLRRVRPHQGGEHADVPASPHPRSGLVSPALPVVPPAPPSRIAPIDRRTRQRLARGRDEIDARIDLHGLTQAQAHTALRRFLLDAQAADARYVLVVTGKGREPERGVLRRQVPLWLGLPEFRAMVVGIDTAHVGHGGEGALYVQVRRKR